MDDIVNPMPTENITIGPATLRVRQAPHLPVKMRLRTREICNFYVEPGERNKGYGTRLLRKVCAKADDANFVLLLTPEPHTAEGEPAEAERLSLEQLVEWYNSFGFAVIQMEPGIIMARVPHAQERVARLAPVTEAILKEFQ